MMYDIGIFLFGFVVGIGLTNSLWIYITNNVKSKEDKVDDTLREYFHGENSLAKADPYSILGFRKEILNEQSKI